MFVTNVLLCGIYGISVLLVNVLTTIDGINVSSPNNVSTTPLPPQIAYYVTHHDCENHSTAAVKSEPQVIHGYIARRPQRRIPDKNPISNSNNNININNNINNKNNKINNGLYRFVVVPKDRYRKFVKSNPKPVTAYQHFNYDVLFEPPNTVHQSGGKTTTITPTPATTEPPVVVLPADMPLPQKPYDQQPTESVRRNPDPQIHIVLRRRRKPGKIVYSQYNSAPIRNGIKVLKIKHRSVYNPDMDDMKPKAHASNVRVVTPGHDVFEHGLDDFNEEQRKFRQVSKQVKHRKKVPIKYNRKPKIHIRRPVIAAPKRHRPSAPSSIRHRPSPVYHLNVEDSNGGGKRHRPNRIKSQSLSIRRPPKDEIEYEDDYDSSIEYPRVHKNHRKHKTHELQELSIDYPSEEDYADDDEDDDDSAESIKYSKRLRKPRERLKLPANHKESSKIKDYTFYITKYDKSDRNVLMTEPTSRGSSTVDDTEIEKKFVPARMLASVRHTEEKYHQPVHRSHPKVKKRVVEKGGHLVYTEDGYEDDQYDHAVEENYAAHRNKHRLYRGGHRPKRDTNNPLLKSRKLKVPEFIDLLSGNPAKFYRYQGPVEQIQHFSKVKKKKKRTDHKRHRNVPLNLVSSSSISYYDTKSKQCDDVDFDDKQVVDSAPEHQQEQQSTKSKKRLKGLGDKIDCMREKLFGSNPFTNPLFKDTYVL